MATNTPQGVKAVGLVNAQAAPSKRVQQLIKRVHGHDHSRLQVDNL